MHELYCWAIHMAPTLSSCRTALLLQFRVRRVARELGLSYVHRPKAAAAHYPPPSSNGGGGSGGQLSAQRPIAEGTEHQQQLSHVPPLSPAASSGTYSGSNSGSLAGQQQQQGLIKSHGAGVWDKGKPGHLQQEQFELELGKAPGGPGKGGKEEGEPAGEIKAGVVQRMVERVQLGSWNKPEEEVGAGRLEPYRSRKYLRDGEQGGVGRWIGRV